MDFSQVRYFLALAETLNFTRAAEQCNVAQPTLTQAIKRLEDELGGPLIHREGKYSRLTELGRTLRAHFEKIEETRHALKASALSVTSGEDAELHIGLMCTIGPRKLSRFLDDFRIENPNVQLFLHDVTPDSIADLLLSGAMDGAICARHGEKHERLDHVPLYSEAMVVAFPAEHDFSKMDTVPLSAIANQRYVDRLHCEFRGTLIEYARDNDIELDIAFTSQREDWIQDMIREGAGISIVPEFSLIAPTLDHRRIVDPDLEREVELTTVYGGTKGRALRQLIRKAKEYSWTPTLREPCPVDQT